MAEQKAVSESAGLALTAESRVDEERGIIRGAKVLGSRSRNGRIYPPDVVGRCYKLYEASQVYSDHDHAQLKHGRARPLAQWGGALRDARNVQGEVFADIHCLKSTPAGAIILEAALRRPDKFGLSAMHLISSEKGTDGVEIVTDVHEVWSVDAVTRPATTRTLFEEQEEAIMPDPAANGGAIAAPPVMGLEEVFSAFLSGALASADLSDDDKASLHKEVNKLKKKYMGGGEEEPLPEEAPAEEPLPEAAPESHARPALPRLSKMNERIQRLSIRQMAVEAEVRMDEELMKALLALPDDEAVERHLAGLKGKASSRGGGAASQRRLGASPGAPRSSGRAAVAESAGKPGAAPQLPEGADRETLKKFWRGG